MREITPRFLDSLEVRDAAIAADDRGRVALTWVVADPRGGGAAWIATSSDSGASFVAPQRLEDPSIRLGAPTMAPIAALGPGGALAVGWGAPRDPGPGVTLIVRASGDGGASFGRAVSIARDTADAFGPALAFRGDGSLFAAWFVPHEPGGEGSASLDLALSPDGGLTWGEPRLVVDSACAAFAPRVACEARLGVALAYRRQRDQGCEPALAVSLDGGQTFASSAMSPGATSTAAGDLAVIWNREEGGELAWDAASGEPGIEIAPWRTPSVVAGASRILGREFASIRAPQLARLGDRTLLAAQAEPRAGPARAVFAVRAVERSGALTSWLPLGADARDGMLAAGGDQAYACWIEVIGGHSRLRVVSLRPRTIHPRE